MTTPRKLDDKCRERIQTSLDESLLVEAAAGTGKTTQLVGRLVAILASGKTEIGEIVAVTFTRKAAGELSLRLRQELDLARTATDDPAQRENLEAAIARMEEARIGTIHSFCADVLRQRPVEAGVDPDFVELTEEEAPLLYHRAFQNWIEHHLEQMSEGLRRALSRLSAEGSRDSPIARLRDAGFKLVEWRDFPTPWRREPFDRTAALNKVVEELLEVADLANEAAKPNDGLRLALGPVTSLAGWIRRAEQLGVRDDDSLEARLIQLLRDLNRGKWRKGYGSKFSERLTRADMTKRRDQLLESLEAVRRDLDADLAPVLRDELAQVVDGYEELKERNGALDFADLLLKTRDLVRNSKEVRHYLQARYSHIFVDEFQDTDPIQTELILLLTADDPEESDWRKVRPVPGKLFLVGDPKQSIYRFRRADVVLYQEVKRLLAEAGVGILNLTRSFRSLRPLQEAINAAFAPEMTGDNVTGQPEYVPLEGDAKTETKQPTLIALSTPKPYGRYRITDFAVDKSHHDAVAAWVHWLLSESGWKIRDPENPSELIPVSPRHVCLLFRRFTSWGNDVTRPYVSGLEARGVPHLLIGARSFHRREEVETLRAALTAIEWPDDELSVFATLKGSLFAVDDGALLRFRMEHGRLHPFRPLPDATDPDFEPIRDALDCLANLHRKRNAVPIVETLTTLLAVTRAHAGFALRPAGAQILANVQRVQDLARNYELGGGLSFRGFVERLDAEAEKSQSNEAPVPEEGAEGVRLMTVHKAKGLEFPVVVLADPTAKLSRARPDRYVDIEARLSATQLLGCAPRELLEAQELEAGRDEAEGVRLAYVAATRARDLLVVPTVGDEPRAGWVSPLNKAVYPSDANWRNSKPAPLCPDFAESSIAERPIDLAGGTERSVRPGAHIPRAGDHTVVWWDTDSLNLDVEANFGLRQEEILKEDADGHLARASIRDYEDWKSDRGRTLEAGSSPTHRVMVPTDATAPPADFPVQIDVEEAERETRRPGGVRFGTLIHAILCDVDYQADGEQIRELTAMHSRILDATPDERTAAVTAVRGALDHPIIERASTAERTLRESPFVVETDDGTILEGTFDLAFAIDGEWTVVDFKTDRDLTERSDDYRRQLAWYVYALKRMTGKPVRGIIFAV